MDKFSHIEVIYGHIRSYKVPLGYQSSGLGSAERFIHRAVISNN